MAAITAFVLFVGLGGVLAVPSKQPQHDISSTLGSTVKNQSLLESSTENLKKPAEALLLLEEAYKKLCKECNGTTSSCECEDESGDTVNRTVRSHGKVEPSWGGEMEDTPGEEYRRERCLLTMGMGRSKGVLQDLLGQNLRGMSTEERLAEFRRRVEALRKKPSESEKSQDCGCKGSCADKDTPPAYILPVPSFSGKKGFEETKQDGKNNLGLLKSVEEALGPVSEIKPLDPLKKIQSFKTEETKIKPSFGKDQATEFTLPTSPFKERHAERNSHTAGKTDILKGMEKSIETVGEIKPVDTLKKLPPIKIDQSKECDRNIKTPTFALPAVPFIGKLPQYDFKQSGKKDTLKGTEDVVGSVDDIKPLDTLKKIPSFKIDQPKDCDFKSSSSFKDLTRKLALPYEPFIARFAQDDLEKGVGTVDITKSPKPFSDTTLGEHFIRDSEQTDLTKTVNINRGTIENIKKLPSLVGGVASNPALRPFGCQSNAPSGHQLQSSLGSTKSSIHSGIKLPAQFLALTKIRERTVDIDNLPDETKQTAVLRKQMPLMPQSSIITQTVAQTPDSSLTLSDIESTPTDTIISSKTSLKGEIEQSNSPSFPDYEEDKLNTSELESTSSSCKQQGPVIEGIIAIPKYIKLH